MTQEEIKKKRKENFLKIEDLKNENIRLAKRYYQLKTTDFWYTEEIESHPREPYKLANPLNGKLVGRMNWIVKAKDEETGELCFIKKSDVIKINGIWV